MAKGKRRGSVRFRKEIGKYVIDYYDNLGKRHIETIGKNWREANDALDEKMHEIRSGIYNSESRDETFRDFARRWLKGKMKIKPSTLVSYEGIIDNHLIPYFGDARLSDLKRKDIQAFVKRKQDENRPSPKTIHNIILVLHQLLADAQIEGAIVRNPFLKIERPRVEKPEREFLKSNEVKALLEKCDARNYAVYYTGIFTGMRRGELFGLKWGDIGWNEGKIHVRRAIYRGTFQTPKSEYSLRRIDMGPRLSQVLKAHRARQNEIRLKAGEGWKDNDLVFCQGTGMPIDPDNFSHRQFKPDLKKAGLRQVGIHALRHTFASILIAAGHPMKYVQHQMGHASINITMDLYGHLMPEVHEGAAQRSEEMIFGNGKEGQQDARQ